jgi:hypothetical protein
MIIGQDLLTELGINLIFDEGIMTWANTIIPMRNPDRIDAHNIHSFELIIWL